jgi:hypothetical protein
MGPGTHPVGRRDLLKLPLAAAAGLFVRPAGVAQSAPAGPPLFRFGAIGDPGSGAAAQRRVATQMDAWRRQRPWSLLLSLGDNVYENGRPANFDRKFLDVYRFLLDDGVPIHSTLGNHDMRTRDGREMIATDGFGFVGGQDEYEVAFGPTLPDGRRMARFLCLNSVRRKKAVDRSDAKAAGILRDSLRESLRRSDGYLWNIVFLHHPIHAYVGRHFFGLPRGHGSTEQLQRALEPEIRETVDLVLAGHDHFFQHVTPRHGIHHLVTGGAGKLRRGAKTDHEGVVFGADAYHFTDFSLWSDAAEIRAIDDSGREIYRAVLPKRR